MSRSTVSVKINLKAIQGHFAPGGDVYDNASSLIRTAGRLAKVYAPKRTGELARSIGSSISRTGLYGDYIVLYATAKHAYWVEKGTDTIFPHGGWLAVPRNQGFVILKSMLRGPAQKVPPKERGIVFRRSVSGQEGQFYLANGMNHSLAEHGYGARV